MKNYLKIIFIAMASVLAFSSALADCIPQPRLVTVTGEAEIKVVPDEVAFVVGVSDMDMDLNLAKEQNDAKVKKILALTKEFKIDPKNVQTSYINIMPRYEYYLKKSTFLGYAVNKQVSVILKDISKFDGFLSAVLKAGVDNVHGIDFRTSELRKYRDEARLQAVKAAKEKAENLAKELGQKIGRPYVVTELPYQVNYWEAQRMQNVFLAAGAGGSDSSESTIALGEIQIKAKVTVSFELE